MIKDEQISMLGQMNDFLSFIVEKMIDYIDGDGTYILHDRISKLRAEVKLFREDIQNALRDKGLPHDGVILDAIIHSLLVNGKGEEDAGEKESDNKTCSAQGDGTEARTET